MRDQHAVWESIAHSFDRSRERTWDHVERWSLALPRGSRVLDLMAGNGRHTATLQRDGHDTVWLDWSRPAARIVADRHDAQTIVADATSLPLADASFDAVVNVAGLHCLPTPTLRARSLAEMLRVLRPGGFSQVTVWSRDAPRFKAQGNADQPLDVVIPWRSDGHDAPRQYHLYTPRALRADAEAAGFEVLREAQAAIVSREPDNLVIELRRPS